MVRANEPHLSGVQRFARRRPLVVFTALAFLIAWAPWGALLADPRLPMQLAMIGLVAPALAALATAGLAEGVQSCLTILRRLGRVRFGARWWIVATGFMPGLYALAATAFRLAFAGAAPPVWIASSPLFLGAGFLWLIFITAGEEIGWRGFALPRLLESKLPPTGAALGLGTVWGVWHLPIYILSGQWAFPWPLFLAFTSLLSVIYLVLFLRSGGSLLPALLLHATTDIAPRVVAPGALDFRFWIAVDALLLLAVSVTLATRYFSRAPNSAVYLSAPSRSGSLSCVRRLARRRHG